jgi:hypothetical protein
MNAEKVLADTATLARLWREAMPSLPVPPTSQWNLWFVTLRHDFETVVYSLEETKKLYDKRRGVLDLDHAVRHFSRVANCFRSRRITLRKSEDKFPLAKYATRGLQYDEN